MITESPATNFNLADKFQAFYELLQALTQHAADLHENLPVHDDASRAVFNSLSRINGFCDQLNLLVSLMREDIRVVDELTSDPIAPTWTAQIEQRFYDWLRASQAAAPAVN